MASSSASALTPSSSALLAMLSTLAPAALPSLPLLTQQAALAPTLLAALRQLALVALSGSLSKEEQSYAAGLVKLLRRLLARGDVKSAKALLGLAGAAQGEHESQQLEAMLCLVIAAHGLAQAKTPQQQLRVILLRLLTETQQNSLLEAASAALKQGADAQQLDTQSVARSAHTLAALLRVLPVVLIQRDQNSLAAQLAQSYAQLSSSTASPSQTLAALHLLDSATALQALGASLEGGLAQELSSHAKPAGWQTLASHLASSARAPAGTASGAEVDEATLDTLLSILPHLERSKLRSRISKPRFAGLGVEEMVALLLDEPSSPVASPSSSSAAPASAPAPAPVPESRTTFAFDPSRLNWGGGRGTSSAQVDTALSAQLKALTLAHAEADSESELDDDDPWAPSRRAVVGFEEELDEIEAPQDRRKGIARLVGERGEARAAWGGEDASEEEEEEERPQMTDAQRAEDTLRRAYIAHGKSVFEKNPNARKSAARSELLGALGAGWDHTLVEDWATVFERNPKRDAILARASVSAPSARRSRTATPSAAAAAGGTDTSDEERPRFGPDRGRGGRIMRGAGASRGGGRGGAPARGGAPGGGGAEGAKGHSGNDRSARNKEKRGNMARQRGHDRKVARGGAGAAA